MDTPINATADAARFAKTASAYDLPPPSYDAEITLVGRGTPAGELLRRYWHPVALSAKVGGLPVRVRLLGEDLVAFRKPDGTPGLLYPRCAHRGADLFYGKATEGGLRCCYHGWTFEPDGICTDMPPEPDRGARVRHNIRQPWYPVEERYGFVFAYLGPPDRKPPLPRYDLLENLPEGWEILADDTTIPSAGAGYMPCNWLQHHENGMDAAHVPILHEHQFPPIMAAAKSTHKFAREPDRIFGNGITELGDSVMDFKAELIFPTVRVIPTPLLDFARPDGKGDSIAWTVPKDDGDTVVFTALTRPIGASESPGDLYDGKSWAELTPEEHQRLPGDFEAQVSQGVITYHSEEHLLTSDRGIGLYRAQLRAAIRAVQAGEDPPLAFGPDAILVETKAGVSIGPAAGAAVPAAAPASAPETPSSPAGAAASGIWKLVMKTPMGDQHITVALAEEGGALTGTMAAPDAETVPIQEGRRAGHTLSWKADVKKPLPLKVAFTLELNGHSLAGTAKPGMFPAAPVTGVRA